MVNASLISKSNEQIEAKFDMLYKEQFRKDSLYWNHIERCSFIDHETVKVGRQGQLYLNDR